MILQENDYRYLELEFGLFYKVEIHICFKNGKKTRYFADDSLFAAKFIESLSHLTTGAWFTKREAPEQSKGDNETGF